MTKQIKLFFVLISIIVIMDMIWFKLYFGNKFINTINNIQNNKSPLRIKYACISYILLTIGYIFFVGPKVDQAILDKKINNAILSGAAFGLIIYGVYDMTNLTVFSEYKLSIGLIDMMWGTILGAFIGLVMYKIKNKI